MLKTPALILSVMKYGESSLILRLYTLEVGRASFVISGVRGSKKKNLTGVLQSGYWVDIVAYYKPGGGLNRIREVTVRHIYTSIPFNPYKRAIAMFCTEVIGRSVQDYETQPALFDFLLESYTFLDHIQGQAANFPIYFITALSVFFGIMPSPCDDDLVPSYFDLINGVFVSLKPDHIHVVKAPYTILLDRVFRLTKDQVMTFSITHHERKIVLDFWEDYYRIHLDHFKGLKSLEVLRALFTD